jgi:hypothetical protein
MVEVCYGLHPTASKEFCWKLFDAQGVVDNLKKACFGFFQVPVLDENGTIEYLSKKYSLINVVLDNAQ